MATGIGSQFTSPDPVNGFGWDDMAGVADDHPAVTGAQVGGFGPAGDTGLVRIGTGAGNHREDWSELLNMQGPMPWLLLATIAYFGLINFSVSARIGR